jgi:hypothetical protein
LTDTLAIIYHGEESKKAGEPQNARETVNENATSLCNITKPTQEERCTKTRRGKNKKKKKKNLKRILNATWSGQLGTDITGRVLQSPNK